MPHFKDYPHFNPNLTPKQIFQLGSFGGTYWRPIKSRVTSKSYHKQHLEFKWKNIPQKYLTNKKCDIHLNKYGVKVGTSLDFGKIKVGYGNKIHMVGYNGIVGFIKVEEHLMMKDK